MTGETSMTLAWGSTNRIGRSTGSGSAEKSLGGGGATGIGRDDLEADKPTEDHDSKQDQNIDFEHEIDRGNDVLRHYGWGCQHHKSYNAIAAVVMAIVITCQLRRRNSLSGMPRYPWPFRLSCPPAAWTPVGQSVPATDMVVLGRLCKTAANSACPKRMTHRNHTDCTRANRMLLPQLIA
jgi:hypothetical protein